MAFHEVQFPADVAFGAKGGPAYSTTVVALASGHEQRNQNWSLARARYEVSHGIKTQAQLDTLIAFFRARKGRTHGFRFKDWSDYAASGEVLDTGDAVKQTFQIIKTYSSGSGSEVRMITKPVSGTVRVLLDTVEQLSGWSVDTTTGIISFDTAPGNGVVVSADYEFDVPVRFDTDVLEASLESIGRSWKNIPLVEIRV